MMHEIRACGVLVVRGEPIESFLLMRHPHRLDLPKGHCEAGESDLDCALRELQEETGITANDIELDPDFRFAVDYHVRYRSLNHELVHKTVVFFLARLLRDVDIQLSEHAGYGWFPWKPPHQIQKETIDPLLAAVATHVEQKRNSSS
jgi:8-oxo-dGTP pyrophosphatase MutT (NUDIX family)